jgi:hypothetical protein
LPPQGRSSRDLTTLRGQSVPTLITSLHPEVRRTASKAIIHYLDEPMTSTSVGLAVEGRTPLRNPTHLSSAISTDAATYAAVPPLTTQAFVVCARTTPGLRPRHHRAGPRRTSQTRPSGARVCPHSTRGKLHVHRPHDGGITHIAIGPSSRQLARMSCRTSQATLHSAHVTGARDV